MKSTGLSIYSQIGYCQVIKTLLSESGRGLLNGSQGEPGNKLQGVLENIEIAGFQIDGNMKSAGEIRRF